MLVTGWIPKGKHEARVDAGHEFKGYGEDNPDYLGYVERRYA